MSRIQRRSAVLLGVLLALASWLAVLGAISVVRRLLSVW